MTSPVSVQEGREDEPRFPEHEKLSAVREQSQAIGEFLDTGGYVLCRHQLAGNNGEPEFVWKRGHHPARQPDMQDHVDGYASFNPEYEEWDDALVPAGGQIEQVLADYFGIDLAKIDAEKRAMLDSLREASS